MSKRLVVCGNGATAAALVVAMARQRLPLRITVVGRGRPWRGVAYATDAAHHLLNVPAAQMSLDQEDPDHFLRWLGAYGHDNGSVFAPRGLYGAYIEDTVRKSLDAAPWLAVEHVSAELLGLSRQPDSWHVFHDRGREAGDAVVLATGIERPSPLLERFGKACSPFVVEDPWAPWDVRPMAHVLIAGTGLTAVDTALNLIHAGHKGPIVMLSRHGLLPLTHAQVPPQTAMTLPAGPLSQRLKFLRGHAGRARHWQQVFDSLRFSWRCLWEGLSDSERRRFLRHAAIYFNAHRHRLAPEAAAELAAARQRNLQIYRGRILVMSARHNHLIVTMRHGGGNRTVCFDKVINCTGPNSNFDLSGQTFVQSLIGSGLVRPDPLGLGIEVDGQGTARGRDGEIQHSLFALGVLCRGAWWESTAIPDIRQQAASLARHLKSLETADPQLDIATNSRFAKREGYEHCISSIGP